MHSHFQFFLWLFFLLNSILSVTIIVLERKRPEKTIAWLLVFILLPPLGLFLYIFLGRNWKIHKLNEDLPINIKDLITGVINKIENPEYVSLVELLAKNSDSPLFIDNDIKIFRDGKEKFACLIEELKKAKHHIHLEYYIVKNDNIGNTIKDILIKKSMEGVKVRFIMDRVGSIKIGHKYIKDLIDAGVDVVQYSYFLAPVLRHINTQINYRNHRKIAIIDGKIGFIGGINIGDEYLGKSNLGYWRDTHLMIRGDFVLGLQAVFIDDFWTIKRADDSHFFYLENFADYFPAPEKSRGKVMQLVKSGPDSESPSIMQGILKMISMAKEHIYITTPYFVPNESIMDALKIASLSGIDVKILFPGKYDHFTVYYASRTYLAELLKCGVEIYIYDKNSFVHSKVITIDGRMSTVGTANMDIRSYELNYEINAVIYDYITTRELEYEFFTDLRRSTKLSRDFFINSPYHIKIIEALARVFSSLL